MSECTNGDMRDLLPELVNVKLAADEQVQVESHVASCPECSAELALLRSLRPALMSAPDVDTRRIAAAVRAQTSAVRRPDARSTLTIRWRMAIAAAAVLAVSALGYVVHSHHEAGVPEVAVTHPNKGAVRDSTGGSGLAAESAHAPVVAPPRSTTVRAPQQQIAAAPRSSAARAGQPATLATSAVLDNLSDLSDEDVRLLTASLDKLSPVPAADPAPGIDPLGASLEDLSAGGS
jgi:Putative zinc-finger